MTDSPWAEIWITSSADDLPLDETVVQVASLTGTERLGAPYELAVELVRADEPLAPEAFLGVPLTLHLKTRTEKVRRIHGVAARVVDRLVSETNAFVYALTFVPRVWALSLTRTTEIFMDLTVPEVIVAKLERAGFARGDDFEERLRATYPKREYIVQYDETDLAFVQRLAEHIGITLFFEQGDERERLILADHNEAFPELPPDGLARFYPRGEEAGVFALSTTTSTLPARYAVKDYNYRTPQVALLAQTSIPDGQQGLTYEFGGHFKTPEEAEQLATIRAEEVACRRTLPEGRSADMRFGAGYRFKLEGHPRGDLELILTEVEHRYRNTVAMHVAVEGEKGGYENCFATTLQAQPYRPARVTPKPRIHGCITAQIEATSDGPYAELDDEGRYRVRFLFDVTDSTRAGASRLVRMAQPHTGPGYGFHFPLRHGVEVLITFIDGDPDRPIISTAVPNPQTPSVVGSGNGTRNIIRTGAGNEINIDDTVGAERIKLSTPFGGSSFQLGAPNTPSSGASLSTTESWNAVAASAVTTATSAASTFADVASIFASGDISALAGATNIMKALMSKAPDILDGVARIAEGVMDTQSKHEQAKADDLNRKADELETPANAGERVRHEESKRLRQRAAELEARAKQLRELERAHGEPYGRQAEEAEAEAAKLRAEAESIAPPIPTWKKDRAAGYRERAQAVQKAKEASDKERSGIKSLLTAEKGAKTGRKVAKDAWSLMSKWMGLVEKGAAAAMAAQGSAQGSAAAAVGRIPGAVPPPASPWNVQAAVGGAALVGEATAMVSGSAEAACVSAGVAILAGCATAMVKSPGAVEVAGMARTLITSGALVDTKSGAIKSVSAAKTTHLAGAIMSLRSGGAMTATSKSSLAMAAASSAKLTAGAAATVKAKGALKMHGGPSAQVKGTKASLEADGATLKLSSAAELKTNGDLHLRSSASAVLQGSDVTISGPTTVSGACTIAKDCTVRGRVYLG
ncbi:MAG: type VI secretion system tip protein TssI/VgrG [Polyangiaceae bacterium]